MQIPLGLLAAVVTTLGVAPARGEAYVRAIVESIKDEPGLLMWDIMNEPFTNAYFDDAPVQEKASREAEITGFVRQFLTYVKTLDAVNAVTVGYTFASQIEPTADVIDVLSFHDYTALRSTVEEAYRTAEAVSRKYGKPMLNTETGCIARGNTYDMALEIAQEHQTGWYLFNLIIQGYWGGDPRALLPGRHDPRPSHHRGGDGLLQEPRSHHGHQAGAEQGRPRRTGGRPFPSSGPPSRTNSSGTGRWRRWGSWARTSSAPTSCCVRAIATTASADARCVRWASQSSRP